MTKFIELNQKNDISYHIFHFFFTRRSENEKETCTGMISLVYPLSGRAVIPPPGTLAEDPNGTPLACPAAAAQHACKHGWWTESELTREKSVENTGETVHLLGHVH